MARLNEAPAPALESIEALKRRFIRQNREIARVNSNQSVRIRNLEIEISRLLAENILLREQAINAKVEAEKWKVAQRLGKEVSRMKEQLEGKLSEVNALVEELGNLPEKIVSRSSEKRRRSIQASDLIRRSSGEQRETRHRFTLSEQDGRLPAILEDKYYPRRTLDALEINGLPNESQDDDPLESPDLGPPPIAHFDEHETVSFNAVRSPRRTSTELIEESERSNKVTLTSVDNRRKRRTSVLLQPSSLDAGVNADVETCAEIEVDSVAHESPKKIEDSTAKQSSRTGSKRKLEMSELEDTSHISKELDDFIFQRKAIALKPVSRPSRFSRPPGRQNRENVESSIPGSPDKSTLPIRRALAPKSTNSPAKRKIGTVFDKPPMEKATVSEVQPDKRLNARIRSRPLAVATEPPRSDDKQNLEILRGQEEHNENTPETPAAELGDFTSPPSANPSTVKQRSAQEMAVTNSVEDVLNGSIGRGSRRARAAVSYAEPNLRDKMRRPGKALVGAVEGLAKTSTDIEGKNDRSGSVNGRAENEGIAQESADRGQALEQNEVGRWQKLERSHERNSEPVSPLGNRKTSLPRISSTASAVPEDDLKKAISRLSVFDGPVSSPTIDMQQHSDDNPKAIPTSVGERRHSQSAPLSSGPAPGISMLRSRRTETISSALQQSDSTQITGTKEKPNLKRSASVTALSNLSSQLSNHGRSNSTSTNTRSSHARTGSASSSAGLPVQPEQSSRNSPLTRRRSMMV